MVLCQLSVVASGCFDDAVDLFVEAVSATFRHSTSGMAPALAGARRNSCAEERERETSRRTVFSTIGLSVSYVAHSSASLSAVSSLAHS